MNKSSLSEDSTSFLNTDNNMKPKESNATASFHNASGFIQSKLSNARSSIKNTSGFIQPKDLKRRGPLMARKPDYYRCYPDVKRNYIIKQFAQFLFLTILVVLCLVQSASTDQQIASKLGCYCICTMNFVCAFLVVGPTA